MIPLSRLCKNEYTMKDNSIKNSWLERILELIFPHNPSAVDFSAISPQQILAEAPRARKATSTLWHSVLSYKHPRTRALIWQIKYKRDIHAFRHGGYILYRTLIENYPHEKIILIPMPVSPARRRERGYNQCELLVNATLNENTENDNKMSVRTDILYRTVHTERQTLKNRNDRLKGAHGIFTVKKKPENLAEYRLIVIDDVLTTGSTLHEAIRILTEAGYKNVRGLTLAH